MPRATRGLRQLARVMAPLGDEDVGVDAMRLDARRRQLGALARGVGPDAEP